MLPVPSAGIGPLEFPTLPPSPSGPNPSAPGAFGRLYDRMNTAEAPRGLPTAMEMSPIIAPATDLAQPFVGSREFPGAVSPDGLKLPGVSEAPRAAHPIDALFKPFQDGLKQVNSLHHHAGALIEEAATGGDVDLHDVMIASEKAGVATSMTLQIRNKLVEAYQDVMRMQV